MISDEILQTRGRIFNIQRYSIHDGPGIRSIVFFKGCPLRCRWCCNPESQNHAILQDAPYYRRSGGGVTLSGGEAFLQPQFAKAVLEACRGQGINTAVETAGFVPFDDVEPCLPLLDTVLMDIKHMDPEKHQLYTGRRNERILENARQIAQRHTHLVIRVPVIPTFNDSEEEIGAIAAFASSLPGKPAMHLLPYHRLGEDKYGGLGREYALEGIPLLPEEKLHTLLRTARLQGVVCRLGG